MAKVVIFQGTIEYMLDLKVMKMALEQLEEERKIPKEKIIEAIEHALAAAYKKDYGKKGQIVRATLDLDTGDVEFLQVKIVVDDSLVRVVPEDQEEEEEEIEEGDERVRYNPEHHIFIEDAKKIKANVKLEDEIVFPLENKGDYGRIAAQTAKQVITQKIREAERESVLGEYSHREHEILSGIVEKVERGMIFVDFNRATGVIPFEEQIRGERYNRGDRIKAYLFAVEDTPRGVSLRLSRTHPKFLEALFALEAPEIASGVVEIKAIAREAGSRSKIAVMSNDPHVDPVGSCVGGRGTRVNTVSNELHGEKIDIIPWSEDASTFIQNALSPAKAVSLEMNEEEHKAVIEVADEELSLAIGKGGQNVRLAAKLTGWRIDIKGVGGEAAASNDGVLAGVVSSAAVTETEEPTASEAAEAETAEETPEEAPVAEVSETEEKAAE